MKNYMTSQKFIENKFIDSSSNFTHQFNVLV